MLKSGKKANAVKLSGIALLTVAVAGIGGTGAVIQHKLAVKNTLKTPTVEVSIDDTVGNTLVSACTLQKDVKAELEKTNNVDAAAYVGKLIAERAIEKGIKEVVYDRGGFIYQGKVQALADAAREAGLEF